MITSWWFGTFFMCPYTGNNHPNAIFFSEGLKPPIRSYIIVHIHHWNIINHWKVWICKHAWSYKHIIHRISIVHLHHWKLWTMPNRHNNSNRYTIIPGHTGTDIYHYIITWISLESPLFSFFSMIISSSLSSSLLLYWPYVYYDHHWSRLRVWWGTIWGSMVSLGQPTGCTMISLPQPCIIRL